MEDKYAKIIARELGLIRQHLEKLTNSDVDNVSESEIEHYTERISKANESVVIK
ncbi:hypothetical protein [Paraliobacillus sediminis]|uniref:hypothetical protein n=1 Tax=Paraliobacillus sediminis TaxID=1885916 RepID=UPI0013C2B02A|nr:hypothetical protein [Paraliobacillus sediminis]